MDCSFRYGNSPGSWACLVFLYVTGFPQYHTAPYPSLGTGHRPVSLSITCNTSNHVSRLLISYPVRPVSFGIDLHTCTRVYIARIGSASISADARLCCQNLALPNVHDNRVCRFCPTQLTAVDIHFSKIQRPQFTIMISAGTVFDWSSRFILYFSRLVSAGFWRMN